MIQPDALQFCGGCQALERMSGVNLLLWFGDNYFSPGDLIVAEQAKPSIQQSLMNEP